MTTGSVYGIPVADIAKLKVFLDKARYASIDEFLNQLQNPLEYQGYQNILKSRLLRIQQILNERIE